MPAGLGRSVRLPERPLDLPEGGNAEGGVEGDPVVGRGPLDVLRKRVEHVDPALVTGRQQGDQRPENDEGLCEGVPGPGLGEDAQQHSDGFCVAAWAYRP